MTSNTNKIKQSAVKCKWQKKVNSGFSGPWFLLLTFAESKENLIIKKNIILSSIANFKTAKVIRRGQARYPYCECCAASAPINSHCAVYYVLYKTCP